MLFPRSSVAKKALMSVTGLMLCGFLMLHLVGNLTLLLNNDGTVTFSPGGQASNEYFEWVAHHYEAIPIFFHIGEILLATLFGLHALFGITLWLQNRAARGSRYVMQKNEGGRTIFSSTMPYTGLLFIVSFLVLHIANFRFGDQNNPHEMYGLVKSVFGSWYWFLAYLAALTGLSFHLSHGFQSAFQSLGISHPLYNPKIKTLGYLFAVFVWIGFSCLPILFFLNGA